ncbi:hypothetical protein [Actinocrispum wychmicini]|uniref:Uncharacterized protein n=1 Tax=Actinocrispum wychmicini TaxID=1213861 RepID=A0A4R2JY84_9PSEU|nr:hypothetical protein [Actinocrispum wychmicini]TCO62388.1 hypothetical protein EV192_102526 [Actinocrispum wychmicini]
METLIGFAVGFFVGTQYGRDGIAKLKESWDAVSTNPEVHQLIRTGASMAGSAVRQVMSGGAGAMIGEVTDMITRKASEMTGTNVRPAA